MCPKCCEPLHGQGPDSKASQPDICVAHILKNAVRLTFFKGAKVRDPKMLFNTRLDSKTMRAIDYRQGDAVDEAALKILVLDAIELNSSNER